MGIDFKVQFPKEKSVLYDEYKCDIKFALQDCKWKHVLNYENIDLSILYDCGVHVWCNEQVKYMVDLLETMKKNFSIIENAEEPPSFTEKDLDQTIEYFSWVAENGGSICVF